MTNWEYKFFKNKWLLCRERLRLRETQLKNLKIKYKKLELEKNKLENEHK